VKLPAASCGASVTEQSGTAPECDTRLRQGFGAVTSRFLPTARGIRAKASEDKNVNLCPSLSNLDLFNNYELLSYEIYVKH